MVFRTAGPGFSFEDNTVPLVGDDGEVVAQVDGNLAMDIAANSVGSLPIDITSNSIGTLGVDLEAQSISDLGVDIEAQSVGDLDFFFNGQASGVLTGSEYATETNNVEYPSGNVASVGTGNSGSVWGYTNNTGSAVYLEQVTGAILSDGYFESIMWDIGIDETGDGATDQQHPYHQPNMPANFDPGLRVPDGGSITVQMTNNTSTSGLTGFSSGIIRTN